MQDGKRRAVLVWHRRAGKEKTCWNYLIAQAIRKVGIYYYFFPHFSQGRKILWDGVDRDGFRLLDHIPSVFLAGNPNSTEMKIRLINGSLIQIIGTNNVDCYDDLTEVLTEEGWKLFKNVTDLDKVATLEDEHLRYRLPSERIEYFYEGEMISFKNPSNDLLVTPNHKFYVKSNKGVYKFKTFDQLSLRNDRIPSNCKWEGEDKSTFEFPQIENKWICGKGRECHKIWERSLPMEDFVALLGIYLAEGSTYQDKKTYRICITQKKDNTRLEILQLLDRCNINYQLNGYHITFEDKQMCEYFSQFGLSDEKFIPLEIKALSTRYLTILFDWLVKGEGTNQNGKISYYSISKRLIDDFQEICIKIGKNAYIVEKKQKASFIAGRLINNFRKFYCCCVRTSKWKSFANNKTSYITKQNYSGNVYCVSVPSGVIKVRRNGKESWCGNSIVGTNPIGCVFTEYSLQDPKAWQLIRPILAENGGWAVFNFTPRGQNHAKEIYEMARGNPKWFCQLLTADDTKAVSIEDIESERISGMSEDFIQQEFYCSFTLGVEGAYYARYLQDARDSGRIGNVYWDTQTKVHTSWDIGIGDSCAIIFYQVVGHEIHVIDYYENHGEGLAHYVSVLQNKPYIYGGHFAPHDIESRSFSSGLSAKDVGASLGICFQVLPTLKMRLEEGIEAVRGLFPRVWFDQTKAQYLIKCLENYRKEFDTRLEIYKEKPRHDKWSHGADAMRYLAISVRISVDGAKMDVDDEQSEAWFRQFNPRFDD
jgi:hypothetical protein